jgi:hypothetical protein
MPASKVSKILRRNIVGHKQHASSTSEEFLGSARISDKLLFTALSSSRVGPPVTNFRPKIF